MTGLACKQEVSRGCLLLFLLLIPSSLWAQIVVDELEPFDFGTLAIPSNTAVSELVFPRTGRNLTIEGDIVLVERGTTGRYLLSGFPPNVSIELEVDDTELRAEDGLTEPLDIDQYDANDLVANEAGEVELQLGGRLQTSGTGEPHEDSLYTGSTTLRFEYWEPEQGDFVTSSANIDLATEVRTSINVEEAQALHFGTLFARTSADDQASLTLSPEGGIEISSPGASRLVQLEPPEVGVLQITGAAANVDLAIEADSGPVLLEHSESPGSAPHFVLDPIKTSPEESGRTDGDGFLEIRVGGTLTTEETAETTVYPEGVYQGTYEMTISY